MAVTMSAITPRVTNHSTGVTLATASFAVDAGDLLFSCYETGQQFSSITDSQSGTWTLGKGNGSGGNDTFIHYRYITVAANITVTVTRTAGTNDSSLQVYKAAGARANNPIGATGNADVVTPTDPRTTTAFTSTINGSVLLATAEDYNPTGGSDTSSDLTLTTSAGTVPVANGCSGFKTLGAPGSQSFQLGFPGTSTATQLQWAAVEIIPAAGPPLFQRNTCQVWRTNQ